ncbi:hypothetical protein ACHAXR_008802 [Thalassiosira sp. AJA248-18]
MSKVIGHSSKLRIQAVEALENGTKHAQETQLIMQKGETISAAELVSQAATQYGISSGEYLSNMRHENVWGGGPEIVALANCLERQIVLLEPINKADKTIVEQKEGYCGGDAKSIYLNTIARFGPPSKGNSIHILSTNQQFPQEYHGKPSNHFLAVFPSEPF